MDNEAPLNILKAVKCIRCEKLHELIPDSREFVTVHGNIMIGLNGGIIGNNFDEEGKLKKITVFCTSCFRSEIVEALTGEAIR